VAPVSVVVPTIGRPALLGECLQSLVRCEPRADEILVIDSSAGCDVSEIVARFATDGARSIRCEARGLGNAFNLGVAEARHEIALLTNDDCTVDPSWVGRGFDHLSANPDALVTGRVRPGGDPAMVPSTIDDPAARVYAGRADFVLFTQSLALPRSAVVEFGGFDGRIRPSAEDNDLSYRWLRSGRRILYEPDFVVWHHEWRTGPELRRLYVGYGVGQGMVYGKHLRRGDLVVVRYLAGALYGGARALVAAALLRRHDAPDARLGFVRGLPIGLIRGWRAGGLP
jgi:GT2 family glycosyltransferase